MPEPIKDAPTEGKEEENKGADNSQETSTDAFGQPTDKPETKSEEKEEGDGKGKEEKGEKKDDKKFDNIPEDHPTIVALKDEIKKVKDEYGGNLSGQREVIKGLQDKIDALTNKSEKKDDAEEDVLFKKEDIKWSKDLTKEEREDMTDTEVKQMDEIAKLKEAQNKIYADGKKKEKESHNSKVEDLQSLVKSSAKELAKKEDGTVDTDLANQIIENVKQFNLEGLDEATVKVRVETARKLLPDYKAPTEQIKKNGKTVDNTKPSDDPFGVDKIVEEASKGSDGNYAL